MCTHGEGCILDESLAKARDAAHRPEPPKHQRDLDKIEWLEDSIRDMLDYSTGWCSDRLTEKERLDLITKAGYKALGIVEESA